MAKCKQKGPFGWNLKKLFPIKHNQLFLQDDVWYGQQYMSRATKIVKSQLVLTLTRTTLASPIRSCFDIVTLFGLQRRRGHTILVKWAYPHIYPYNHTCLHPCMHPCIPACFYACMHPSIRAYTHASMHSSMRAIMPTCVSTHEIRACRQECIHAFI